jgi:hypothetical protein
MTKQVVTRETGEVESLSIIDRKSGCDWVSDLIGNADGFAQFIPELDADGDETGRWIADASTIEWWQHYISDHETVEDAIESLRGDLETVVEYDDIAEIIQRVHEAIGDTNDMECERGAAEAEIESIREEYGLTDAEEA